MSAEWLPAATGWTVGALELEVIGAGEGFMGQLARVDVTSPDPDVRTLVG